MKIFVTVGTTSFESLIKYADSKLTGHKVIAQIANGEYHPKSIEYFEYTGEIQKYYDWADIIITHAGAGSVYKLLEQKKRIVVIPNLERIDNHQLELANFVEKNNYGEVFYSIEDIQIKNQVKLTEYKKDNFFKIKELLETLDLEEEQC